MNLLKLVIVPILVLVIDSVKAYAINENIPRGEYLARTADCMACHSAQGQDPYAGGLAIKSDLGTIWSTNITPDKTHGIGNYSLQQFSDAVRKGLRADGTFLYPAMPYPDYARITDDDIADIYAYFMQGVQASAWQPPTTQLSFPFNLRFGIRFWNFFFANNRPFKPTDNLSPELARGAYLVEGPGHCGSCHTPRSLLFNEKALDSSNNKFLAGGELNGWPVPALRGIARWSRQEIVDYLKTGRNAKAGVAGEMTAVVFNSTSHFTEEDLQAVAAYLKYLGGNPAIPEVNQQQVMLTANKLRHGVNLTTGERLYLDNCNACHFVDGLGAPYAFPQLVNASVVSADNPQGLIQIIINGATLPSTETQASTLKMPGFGKRLTDQQIVELANFVRQGFANHASSVSLKQVEKVRQRLAEDNLAETGSLTK